jgi:hypothetical protein
MEVIIGADPHKASNTIAVLDGDETVVTQRRFPNTHKGFGVMIRVARSWPPVAVGGGGNERAGKQRGSAAGGRGPVGARRAGQAGHPSPGVLRGPRPQDPRRSTSVIGRCPTALD